MARSSTPARAGPTSALNWLVAAMSRIGAVTAALILISMTAYVLIEIALRVSRGSGTNVLVEFIGYGLAGMTFLAASSTMREGGLVRVSVLVERVSPTVRRALDAVCLATTIATITLLGWHVGADMWRSFERDYETDSLVPLPMWLPPLPLVIGMLIFLIDMLLHLILVVRGEARLADQSPDVI